MKNSEILVVGSIALDTIETPAGKAENALGGSALFFSAASRFFAPINIVAVVGEDFPIKNLDFLKKHQVNFDGLQIQPGKTFHWHGKYNLGFSERESICTDLNVFANFKPAIPERYRHSGYIFLANIDPELQLQVLSQVSKPKLVILDTMNFWIQGKRDPLLHVMKQVDIVIVNDSETRELTGETDLIRGAKNILKMGPKYVIVKKGEHGAFIAGKDFLFMCPAYPVHQVLDPTGAGDSFAGGFVGYLAKTNRVNSATLRQAVAYGSILGSFAVEEFSFKRLIEVTASDVSKRYKHFYNLIQF